MYRDTSVWRRVTRFMLRFYTVACFISFWTVRPIWNILPFKSLSFVCSIAATEDCCCLFWYCTYCWQRNSGTKVQLDLSYTSKMLILMFLYKVLSTFQILGRWKIRLESTSMFRVMYQQIPLEMPNIFVLL